MNTKQKQFLSLRADGLSFDNIAKKLKVAKSTLIQWSKLYQNDIDDLKFLSMQQLKEQYQHTKQQKYEQLLKHLSKIDKAIEDFDYSKATIKDLMLVRNDIQEQLNQIESYTNFKDTKVTQTLDIMDVMEFDEIATLQLNET